MIESKLVPAPLIGRWLPIKLDLSSENGVYLGQDLHEMDGEKLRRFDRFTRAVMAIALLATIIGSRMVGLEMHSPNWGPYLTNVGVWLGVLFFASAFKRPVATALALCICEFILAPMILISFSYIAATYGAADQTALVAQFDQWLGFDWPSYITTVLGAPWLNETLSGGYHSLKTQIVILPFVLILCGRPARARLLLNCFWLGAFIVILTAMAVPTIDAYIWHGDMMMDERGYTGIARIDHLQMLREGSMQFIKIDEMTGIICFPSFHTVAGCLFAGFSAYLGPARFGLAALNGLLIAATPHNGGHYLADTLAGVIIGIGLIAAAEAYTRRRPETKPA